jgi:FAD/FMN-containing dehydrogenase
MPDFQAEWKNWGRNIDIRPRQIFFPSTLKDLSGFIKQANQDDRRVRVLGSGWSFNDVAVSHDDLVDLSGWNRVLAFSQGLKVWGHEDPALVPHPAESPVLIAALLPQVTDSGRRFAHVLAGTNLKWLYHALDNPLGDDPAGTRDPWGLMTMGASAGQTVAGLVSTSTHGADFDLTPPADFVRAIDLIAPDGKRHWFERAAPNSITDPNKLPNVFQNDPPTPVVHYNDDEFFAVLVSMGCMGIMRSVILEVAPQFGLSQRVGTSTWETLKPLLKSGVLFNTLPPWNGVQGMKTHPAVAPNPVARALEIFINPYRISNDYFNDAAPDRACLVTSRAESSQFDKFPGLINENKRFQSE